MELTLEQQRAKAKAQARLRLQQRGAESPIQSTSAAPVEKTPGWLDAVTGAAGAVINPTGGAMSAGAGLTGLGQGNSDHNLGQSVAGGVWNAPKEALTTSIAGQKGIGGMIDSIENPIIRGGVKAARQAIDPLGSAISTVLPDNTAAVINENYPEYHPEGTADALVTEVAQAGVGAAAGGVGAGRVALQNAPKWFARAAKFFAVEGGAASTIDQDTQGLFVGEDPTLYKVWGGLALDEKGNYNEELLKKRFNILVEAATVSKAGEMAGRTAVGAGKFVWDVIIDPGKTFFQRSAKEQAIVRDIADTLQGSEKEMSNAEQYAWRQKLANNIDQFAEVKTQGLSDVQTPTGEVIPDANIQRDTMTAYTRSLQPDIENLPKGDPARNEALLQKAKADMLRSGQKGKAASDLEVASTAGARELEDLNVRTERAFGGRRSMEQGRENVVQTGHDQADVYRQEVFSKEGQLEDAKAGARSLVKDDPQFGPTIDTLGNQVDLDVTKRTRQIGDEIVEGVDEQSVAMTKRKNELYKAIPDDVPVNEASYTEAFKAAEPYMSPDLRSKVVAAGINFGKLNDVAGLELQPAIRRAQAAGNREGFEAADGLRKLYDNISKDQLDYLVTHGDTDVRDAAQAAKDFYTNEYAPSFRQGPGEELQQLSREKKNLRPVEYKPESRAVVKKTFEDPNKAEQSQQIIDILKRGGKEGKVPAYIRGTIAEEAQTILNKSGKLTPEDVAGFTAKLTKFGPVNDPDTAKFLTRLRDKNASVEDLTKELETVRKVAKEEEEAIYGDKLKEFFEKDTKGNYRGNKRDGFAIFEDIMTNNPNKIDSVRKALKKGDTVGQSALEAAYGKYIQKHFFETGSTPGGSKDLNLTTIKNRKDQILEVGDKIFGDNSPIMHAQRILLDESEYMAKSETQRALRLHDLRDSEKGMRDSVATAITWLFGTLDRTGARIRAAAGRGITRLSKAQQAREIMSKMYADPKEFSRVLRQISEKDLHGMSKESKDALWAAFTKGGTFADWSDNENERPQNQKLNKASLEDARPRP